MVAGFFGQQSHIRIWDAETLITLAVLSLQEYNLSISCLAFSQEVCWLRQSLHLIIMHDNKYSDELHAPASSRHDERSGKLDSQGFSSAKATLIVMMMMMMTCANRI